MASDTAMRKQQDLQAAYQTHKSTLQSLASKVGEIEGEIEEHKLVLDTLKPLPGDRTCFRLINGVLVQRTVGEVTPALTQNSEGLKQVLEGLVRQYKKAEGEMERWKRENRVQVVSNP